MPEFKQSRSTYMSRPGTPSRGGFSRPSFGSGPRRTSASGGNETFKTTCSKCNNQCEVPFKPNGKKPVFCKDCFVREERPSESSYGNNREHSGFEKRSFGTERSFVPRTTPSDPRIDDIKKELALVSSKLDTLIKSLEGAAYSSILNASTERNEKPKK